MHIQQKLTPFVWYQSGAEDAVAHYQKVFGAEQVRVIDTQRWGENSPGAAGTVMIVNFELFGVRMTVFNGGSYFKLNESSAHMLRDLLSAVAVYAAGGRAALENHAKTKGGNSTLLLRQLK